MKKILIRDGAVFSSEGWFEPGYILVEGQEVKECRAGTPPDSVSADEVIYAAHKAVIPGLLNNHTHLSQTFMRGLAGGRTLISWLKERIWPLQAAMTPDDLYLAALLGLVENIHCGVTHMVNHHKMVSSTAHTDAVLRAAETAGLHFTLARSWVDRGTNAEATSAIMDDLTRLFETWHQPDGLIHISSGPMATWRVSEETLRASHALSREHGSFTHIHVSENQDEVQMCLDDTKMRPVEWLDSLGVLDEQVQLVHGVWFDDCEIERIEERGSTIVHCPISNAVLASGIAPLKKFLDRGIDVRLGCDGSASADNQDLWEVVKSALLFSRASTLDASSIAPADVLKLAFSQDGIHKNGPADIIIVDLNHTRAVPVHDVPSTLTLCTHGCDVETVMVRGNIALKDRRITFLDEEQLITQCQTAVKNLRKKAGIME